MIACIDGTTTRKSSAVFHISQRLQHMRYAIGIEYDGSGFNGWQFQLNGQSVQASLEQAIARVADHEVSVVGAGRTDTGVHARCQVAHFDAVVRRTDRQWLLGINSHLPASVCVRWVREVDEAFHARFSAVERQYRYIILNRWTRPALHSQLKGWCRYPLETSLMNEAALLLKGEQDFSAFRSAGCKSRHAVREINHIAVTRDAEELTLDIAANGFLYHMVRNIVGTLIVIGRGKKPVSWIPELLESKDRSLAGVTVSPAGLYFMCARYPQKFGIPVELESFPAVNKAR